MKKTVLVTGGAGFIGFNLIQKLSSGGYKVLVLDNFSSKSSKKNMRQVVKNFKTTRGSILNKSVLYDIFSNKIDTVIHLAAKTGVRSSTINPDLHYKTNVIGTLRLLQTMNQFNVRHIIVASSSSVYGNSVKVPFSENDLINTPISQYAASKIAAESICSVYAHLYKINTTILRFFTAYGPGNRRDMAAYLFLDAIMHNRKITIFGDGTAMRDFTYVDDISNGIYTAIKTPFPLEIINLGNNQSVSINSFINILEKITGKKAIIEYKPGVKADMTVTKANITKAHHLLGWKPKIDLNTGLTNLYHWYLAK